MSALAGKSLLITGGTGSFGNAVLRRYLETDVREIRIFSRDEKKQHDMRQRYPSSKVKYFIGDVRDRDSVVNAVRGADLVFHAAALKQVPSCEFHPMEAVRTNVIGGEHVLDAAIESGVSRVVVLSTDKAVYPINAMGMTKALLEKIAVARSRAAASGATVICTTRYGNVMGSRGSVIPLFVDQVLHGKPITITDPHMTRFLMLLEEAVDLVEHAFASAQPGDLFVRKAPACTIADLAEAIRQLFDSRSEIRIIGTRHGEKLYETLVNREEMVKAIDEGDYFRIPADTRDLNYDQYFVEGEKRVADIADYTSHNTARLDIAAIKSMLLRIEPIQRGLRNHSPEQIAWPE